MKIIALGDIHGRTVWEKIVSGNEFDKIVFTGDYFDSREHISPEQQKSNFQDIISYKKANMDKVVLLFGNHELHYLKDLKETYTGYQYFQSSDFQKMIQKALNEGLMQMCFIYDKFLFSHAGVTKTWLKSTGYTGEENLEIFINELFQKLPSAFKYKHGKNLFHYGDHVGQSPIWVRPSSLFKDALDDYTHIVGHTVEYKLVINETATIIDTLGTSGQYLAITDGKMTVMEQEVVMKENYK